MSKEVRIALLAIVTVAVAYWGYKFIIGKNILKQSNVYYVEYSDVEGLSPSTPVSISGVQVGMVAAVNLKEDDQQTAVVTLDLERGVRIPKSTRVRITVEGLMASQRVELVFDKMCSGDDCAQSGDYLQGETYGMLKSMLDPDELNQTLDEVLALLKGFVGSFRDDVLEDQDNSTLARTLYNLEMTTGRFSRVAGRLDKLLANNDRQLNNTFDGLDTLSTTLQDNAARLDTIFANFAAISSSLERAGLDQTIDTVEVAVSQLRATLVQADEALDGFAQLMNKVNQGEGTLGKLASDEELYLQLSTTLTSLDSLLSDFEEKPYRYMPFKSRRKVQKYDRKDGREE